MIVKKPIGALLPYSNACYSCAHAHTSTTSSSSRVIHRRTSWRSNRRHYADVASDKSENLVWPHTKRPGAIPTPYEIFNQHTGSPYSKHRFYELVKLYHPDRNGNNSPSHSVKHLSHAIRLERYRLIIAANEILSDPTKRAAYDQCGAGWTETPAAKVRGRQHTAWRPSGWQETEYHSPFRNATWEDWERWYQRDKTAPQRPLFVANGVFASLVLVLASLGGLSEAMRSSNHSMSFIEQRDRAHRVSSQELRRRQEGADGSEQKIQSFLSQRDPKGYGITDPQEEGYRRLLPDPEICSSDDIKGRSMDVYTQDEQDTENGR